MVVRDAAPGDLVFRNLSDLEKKMVLGTALRSVKAVIGVIANGNPRVAIETLEAAKDDECLGTISRLAVEMELSAWKKKAVALGMVLP